MLKPEEKSKLKKKLMQEFEEALEARLNQMPEDRPLSIDEIETIALEVREEIGRKLAQELGTSISQACERSRHPQKHPCARCKRQVRWRGYKERTIVTMSAEVRFRRALFYCKRCDRCTVPLDKEMGLPHHGYTARVEQVVARTCALHSFKLATEELERLTGLRISDKEAQRITRAVGEFAISALKADVKKALSDPETIAEQHHEPKLMIYVLLDGIHTPMRQGWKESKVGCVVVEDQIGRRKTYYTHHIGSPEQIGKQLFALASQAGAAECARVVALGDGAPWIWRQIKLRFPHAVQILDFFHASCHVSELLRSSTMLAPGAEINSAPEAQAWRDQALEEMRAGKTDALLKRVRSLPVRDDGARELRRGTIAYFERNRERMKYDEYVNKGFQIGSGQIESGCKQVVGHRMKGAGMRWKEPMAQAMGSLRSLLLSHGRWDEVVSRWPGRAMQPIPAF